MVKDERIENNVNNEIDMKRNKNYNNRDVLGGSERKLEAHSYKPGIEGAKPRETYGRWFIKDVCGIITVIFVWFLIIWPCYFVVAVLSESWPLKIRIPVGIIFTIFSIGALWSHGKCMLTNPGTVPLRSLEVEYPMKDETLLSEAEGMRYCYRCEGPKPPKAHHCSTCQRCILKMDHHCPWMNNCIGMYNFKHFMLFLLYVSLMSGSALACIAGTIYSCAPRSPRDKLLRGLEYPIDGEGGERKLMPIFDESPDINEFVERRLKGTVINTKKWDQDIPMPPTYRKAPQYNGPTQICNLRPHNVVFCLLLGLESLAFGLFTFVMFIDAVQVAASGDSQIDELAFSRSVKPHQKKVSEMRQTEKRTCKTGMQEFCGSKMSPKWMFPINGCNDEYFRGLTELDRYVLSATYWDRYVIPRARSIQQIEQGVKSFNIT